MTTTNCQDILTEAGYPTDVLCLDFESYYDTEYSLTKMPTIEYITDPRWELAGLGILKTVADEPWFVKPCNIRNHLGAITDNVTVLVKHARFDITVLQHHFGIVPKYIIDLEDLTRHYDSRMSHKLKDLAKMHKLKDKGDTNQFKGLHYADMTPYQRKALVEYTINDVELEMELFKIYLPRLSNPKTELQLARHTLDLWLHKRFQVDLGMARKIKTQMRGKIASAIAASGKTPKELRSKKFATWLQEALPDGEDVPMKQGKRGNIPALAKTDKACQQLAVHPKKEVRDLILAKQGANEWNAHIKKIGTIVSQSIANGGLLRVALNYHPCHTGRWGGAEKYNLLNMTKRDRGGIITDPLKKETRKVLSAPDGYLFGPGDSCQIEARIAFWLAGQQDMLDKFANGEDLYSEYASKLFHEPVRKPRKDDPPDVYFRMDLMRNTIGKTNMLGDQYGLGATRFHDNCLSNPVLRPLFDNGTYDFEFCKRAIDLYRKTCYKVPQYWDRVEKAFRRVIRFPHLEVEVGPVTFRNDHGTVEIVLPSGRVLYYRHAKVDRTGSIKYHHGHLWGGSILENLSQSISRCLLGFWILKCEEAGLPVQMHLYDDITTILPVDQAEEGLAKQMEIMRTLPKWASGLPVDVEGRLSKTL
jgi:DNA polymerase